MICYEQAYTDVNRSPNTAAVVVSLCGKLALIESCYFQIGPEKGVTHLAVAAVVNAIWDLWAKIEGKVHHIFTRGFCLYRQNRSISDTCIVLNFCNTSSMKA